MSLPECLKPIAWLSGRWSCKDGQGKCPNSIFHFHDDMEFVYVGQPIFHFNAVSRHPLSPIPLHQEKGFLCFKPSSKKVALVVSHNFGLISLEEGYLNEEADEIILESVSIARMSFTIAPVVKKFKRLYKLISPRKLLFVLFMETEKTPLCEHSQATYTRVDSPPISF